ncbi:MAG: hypothetical protein ACFFAH_08655 [Promethearchaeota archaeon]
MTNKLSKEEELEELKEKAEIRKKKFSFEELEEKMGVKSLYTLLFVLIIINLFFIQAFRIFLPGIYISITHLVWEEDFIMNFLIIFTFAFFFLPALTNKICKRFGEKRVIINSIYIIVILRLLIAFQLPSKIEIICAGLIIPFYGFFLIAFITLWIEKVDKIELNHKVVAIVFSIYSAFLFDYFLRTIGFSQDITILSSSFRGDWRITQYYWLIIQIPLSILIIYFTKKFFHLIITPSKKRIQYIEKPKEIIRFKSSYSLIFAGIGMFLFLQFNLFLYPNAIAQITETNYYITNVFNIASLTIAICIILFGNIDKISNNKTIGILNCFMIGSLILFFFYGKILTFIAMILVSISLVVMHLNLYFLLKLLLKINLKWEKLKTISNSITIALLFMLVFSILHIFSTEWAYTIQIFKGWGPYIMILVGITFSILTYLSNKITSQLEGAMI